ncbi:hypothetical protein V5P93_006641 [Actinokineospora auranticolor]|uniref:Excreted virulence factor EspC (Type VII ESX diderm) n=1 Tax=Actinokineospora auranticolor TaxID=155976 RepID=A0A2S6GWY6_9PSEU|nr:hypothetical protein [Actinokineospora auranticolor]PPK69717.1 hypothetical protein CLV40_103327 [Actinokineospora auranticolor]
MGESDVGGYRGEESAFRAYTAGVNPLADQLHGLADRDLHGPGQFGAHAFSKIGDEVGLAQALRSATQRQADGVRSLATSYGGTAEAVRNTWTNLSATEDDTSANVRRAAGDLA